jgi:hypothetical protein
MIESATAEMAMPDWLARRRGQLERGVQPETRFVLVNGEPLYKLEVRPAVGRYTCTVTETANGRRLDDGAATFASFDEALAEGLERLRERLGW